MFEASVDRLGGDRRHPRRNVAVLGHPVLVNADVSAIATQSGQSRVGLGRKTSAMTLGRDHANDGNRSTLTGMSERIGVRHFAAFGRQGAIGSGGEWVPHLLECVISYRPASSTWGVRGRSPDPSIACQMPGIQDVRLHRARLRHLVCDCPAAPHDKATCHACPCPPPRCTPLACDCAP